MSEGAAAGAGRDQHSDNGGKQMGLCGISVSRSDAPFG
jgi:hypothetical protein